MSMCCSNGPHFEKNKTSLRSSPARSWSSFSRAPAMLRTSACCPSCLRVAGGSLSSTTATRKRAQRPEVCARFGVEQVRMERQVLDGHARVEPQASDASAWRDNCWTCPHGETTYSISAG